MAEKPILFNGSMVRAILEGKKTQTRRVIKPQPPARPGSERCPYNTGDRLWVRETAYISPPYFCSKEDATLFDSNNAPRVVDYIATASAYTHRAAHEYRINKTPSIHMPRWASSITLDVISVKAQLLQDITEDEAAAEGIERHSGPYILDFAKLWDEINGKSGYTWNSNPWVWAIAFKVR